jgi:CDGSH-type Zn-finger protein
MGMAEFRLHPLIHTLPEFNLAQDMVFCQCGEKENPHRPYADGATAPSSSLSFAGHPIRHFAGCVLEVDIMRLL